MMYIVSIYDRKAEVYLNPFAARALGEAQRMFQDSINAPKSHENPLSMHPEDFDLYEIGSFDVGSGQLQNLGVGIAPRLLVHGGNLLNK